MTLYSLTHFAVFSQICISSITEIRMIYDLSDKQFGSQMRPQVLRGLTWIQIVCKSSKFSASGQRVEIAFLTYLQQELPHNYLAKSLECSLYIKIYIMMNICDFLHVMHAKSNTESSFMELFASNLVYIQFVRKQT